VEVLEEWGLECGISYEGVEGEKYYGTSDEGEKEGITVFFLGVLSFGERGRSIW
jgi:hypothetical protein